MRSVAEGEKLYPREEGVVRALARCAGSACRDGASLSSGTGSGIARKPLRIGALLLRRQAQGCLNTTDHQALVFIG